MNKEYLGMVITTRKVMRAIVPERNQQIAPWKMKPNSLIII
jgi:hypothetical protein